VTETTREKILPKIHAKGNPMNEPLKKFIQDVPNFPKPGILFKDITPLLSDAPAFKSAIDQMAKPFENAQIGVVAGIESRGFLLATPIAYRLNAGVVLIRKKGKLPRKTVAVQYDLEYGQDVLEAHADAFPAGTNVLLVDDVLATGGTAQAACELLIKIGGKLAGLAFLLELSALNGRTKLVGQNIHALLDY
jgi:adenine phosphoribosyltransferase